MRLGLLLDRHDGISTTVARFAATAEQAGFDAVWLSENWLNPFAAVSGVAQATTGIAIGMIAPAGDIHPLHTAEEISFADHVAAGRLMVALRPANGVDADRFAEACSVVRLALSGRPFRHEGVHWMVPAGLPEHDGASRHPEVQPAPAPAQIRLPVLVVEDDGSIKGAGVRVTTATIDPTDVDAATEALHGCRSRGFDLVLCRLPAGTDPITRFGRLVAPRLRAIELPRVILDAMDDEA